MQLRILTLGLCLMPTATAGSEDLPCELTGELSTTACALRAEKGEDRDLRPEAYFFEPSKVLLLPHIFRGTGEAPTGSQDRLAVEVEFNETIFPYQRRASPDDRHFGGFTFALGLTPMYRVRIWKERSAPVRVPSFMPRGTAQVNWLDRREPGRQWGERSDGNRGRVKMTSLMAALGHHSNGQDGCLFADVSGVGFPEDSCPTAPTEIRVNRLNGSFSTNYLQLSVFRAHFSVPKTATLEATARKRAGLWGDDRRASYAFSYGVTYEWNFPFDTFGGALEKPIRPIYGMNRLRVLGGYERYPVEGGRRTQPRFKVTAWVQLIDNKDRTADCDPAVGSSLTPCAPRVGFGADINVGLGSRVDYLGAYARFYHGQDYYNLSFPQRKQDRLQLGLSFTPGRSRGPAFPTLEQRVLEEERKYLLRGKWQAYRDYVRCHAGLEDCDLRVP